MEFIPTNEYMEVSLQEGLNALQIGRTDKLFSDGWTTMNIFILIKRKDFVMRIIV